MDNNKVTRIIQLADLHDSDVSINGKTIIIHYPVLGQGSMLSEKIQDIMDGADHRIRMIPSECTLEVTVY